jgi:hypothetical protein
MNWSLWNADIQSPECKENTKKYREVTDLWKMWQSSNNSAVQDQIKRRINSGNACCHSVQNLLSPTSKHVKIKTHKPIILPVVLYEFSEPREDNWVATWREKKRLRSRKPRLTAVGIRCSDNVTPLSAKFGTNFAGKRRSLSRYNSLVHYRTRSFCMGVILGLQY